MKTIMVLAFSCFFSSLYAMEEHIIEQATTKFSKKPSCDLVMLLLQKGVMHNTNIMRCDENRCVFQGQLDTLSEDNARELCRSNYVFVKKSNALAIGVATENDFYNKGMSTCVRNKKRD